MKIVLMTIILCVAPLMAQTEQTQFAAVGVSYNPGQAPTVAGTGLYAKLVAGTGTYAFTVVDALPTSVKPAAVTTQMGAGIAQKIATIGKIKVFIPTSAGISYSGDNTGWAWTTGGLLSIPIGQSKYRIMPSIRVVKSSVSNNSDYQVISGIMFGVGW